MTKSLEAALEKIRALPDDQQNFAAALMLHFISNHTGECGLTPEHEAMLQEAATRVDLGWRDSRPA